jgi:phage gp16-like protein
MRGKLISKIHVAKKQLDLDEDCYRDLLRRTTGKDSCSQMSDDQLDLVIGAFKVLGFKPTASVKKAGIRKLADSPQAKMIRGMWLDLHQMGAVKNPSEDALAAYVKRIAKVDDLHWIDGKAADLVINTLRSWKERVDQNAQRPD